MSTTNNNFRKLNNAAIALGAGLFLMSAGLAACYKNTHPVRSWIFTGITFMNAASLGAWIWMKNKTKEK